MSQANKVILQQANAAITKGDYEGFLQRCTEDTVWHFVGDVTLDGKEAVRTWMAATYKEAPAFEVDDLVAEGDFVVAVGKIDLKNETGELITHSYCDVWKFRDGKMAALKAFVKP